MVDVLDPQTKQIVDHPAGELADAWQDGTVHLVAGQQYMLKTPDGRYVGATPDKIAPLVQNGAQFVDQKEYEADAAGRVAEAEQKAGADAAKEKADKYGGALGAGLFGALSQATIGAADYAIPKAAELESRALHSVGLLDETPTDQELGQNFREGRAAQEEAYPTATAIGEGIGAIAPTLLMPEVGALSKVGAAAEGLGTLGRIAARTAAHGIIGALQGAQYGVAKAISDDAIQDHELTAQSILSEVGPNALWGGALGAGFGALGAAASEGLRAFRAPRAALVDALARGSGSAADIAETAGGALGVPPAEGLGEKVKGLLAKVSAAASGKDPEAIMNVWNNRADLAEADAIRDQAMRDVRAHGDSILSASKDVEDIWKRGMKRTYMASKLEGVDAAEAATRSRALYDHVITKLNGMLDESDRYGNTDAIKGTLKYANEQSHALDAAIEKGNVGEMYALTDDLKKAVGKPTAKAARLMPGAAPHEAAAMQIGERQQAWKDMYSTLQVGLEDEGTWKEMGATQARVNKAYTNLIDARQRFNSALVTDIGRDPADPWARAQGIDPAKVGGYVRGLVNPEKDLTHAAVRDYLQNTRDLAGAMQESFDLPAAKAAAVRKIADSAEAFQGTLQKAEKSLVLTNQFEELRRVTGGNAMAAAGALGTMGALLGGAPGAAIGAGLGRMASAFTAPAQTIEQLARVEKMVRSVDTRITRGLRGLAAGEAARTAAVDVGTYARKSSQIARLAQQPEAITDRIGRNLGTMRQTAPRLADSLTMTGLAGLALLRDKLPPVPPGDPLRPEAKCEPPRAQKESWLRYYEAVRDPLGVVDDLKNKRLSVEGIEVLKTVYPKLYGRVQEKTLDEMASGRLKDLDSQQRMGLGLLLDLPLPELQPGYVAARQAAYQSAAAGKGGPEGGAGPKRKIDLTKTRPTMAANRVEAGTGG